MTFIGPKLPTKEEPLTLPPLAPTGKQTQQEKGTHV